MTRRLFLASALLVLLAGTAQAQIAFDAGLYTGNTTATSQTTSFTTSGSNRYLLVAVWADLVSDLISGVTYNAVSMTLIDKQLISGDRYHYLFGLANPASGAHNIVISASSSCFLQAVVASYTGVRQTGNPEAHATADLTGTQIPMSLTTLSGNAWTVLTVGSSGGFNGGVVNYTQRARDTDFGGVEIGDYGPITPPALTSMSTTANSINSGLMVALAPFTPPCGRLSLLGAGC